MKIVPILLFAVLTPVLLMAQAETPARMPVPELIKLLDAHVTAAAEAGAFSGAVLIAKDSKVLYQRAVGFADIDQKTPNTTETRFNLGSMNKMFTSVAIAQLVEKGKIQYSDTVAFILPDYPNPDAAKKIKVEHLLSHASGLGDFFTDEFLSNKDKISTLKDYLPYFANRPLQFEPGTKKSYSNAGFVVAGLIVEKASGENYFDYIREHIYKPAGMNASFGFEDRKKQPLMATGYTKDRGKLEPNEYVLVAGSPAGGGYSTLADLLKFANALRNNKLARQDLVRLMIGMDRPPESTYGYGFNREETAVDFVVGHAGGAEGMNGDLDIYWKSGYVVIALANQDPQAAEDMTNWIKQRIQP